MVQRSPLSLSPHWCKMCRVDGEGVDYTIINTIYIYFLHCPIALSLCLRCFRKAILCSMTSCAAFILLERGVGVD